jgi:hypothetical protein
MWPLLLALVALSAAPANDVDLVLSSLEHGRDHRHIDRLLCDVPASDGHHSPVRLEPLIEDFVLPGIMFCPDTSVASVPSTCYDPLGNVRYRLVRLECTGDGCVAHFDCGWLVDRCWRSLIATGGCMLTLIVVRVLWTVDRRQYYR